MIHVNKSSAMLAAAALTFALSGSLMTAPEAQAANVKCVGANSCKGTSACKTASSSCKGLNSCKGQGWISVSAAKCKKLGGKVSG